MLLKFGAWMMAAALTISVGVALIVVFRASDQSAAAVPASAVEETTTRPQVSRSYEQFDRPQPKPESDPEASPRKPSPKPEAPPRKPVSAEPEEPRRSVVMAAGEESFPVPEEDEVASLDEPRNFAPDANAGLTLTLPSLGVRNAPVYDSDSEQALANGVAHVPETSMPWDRGAQRNVYLAAHRLGYPGSGSRLLFYELDQLGRGDEVVLKGRGKTYRYKVSETLIVDPDDSRVMGQMIGRDMVTLQTCTPIPTYEKRLVVRADRVG